METMDQETQSLAVELLRCGWTNSMVAKAVKTSIEKVDLLRVEYDLMDTDNISADERRRLSFGMWGSKGLKSIESMINNYANLVIRRSIVPKIKSIFNSVDIYEEIWIDVFTHVELKNKVQVLIKKEIRDGITDPSEIEINLVKRVTYTGELLPYMGVNPSKADLVKQIIDEENNKSKKTDSCFYRSFYRNNIYYLSMLYGLDGKKKITLESLPERKHESVFWEYRNLYDKVHNRLRDIEQWSDKRSNSFTTFYQSIEELHKIVDQRDEIRQKYFNELRLRSWRQNKINDYLTGQHDDEFQRELEEKGKKEQVIEEERNRRLNYQIDNLGFSVRVHQCLKREGLETLGDIVKKNEMDLLNIRNFGKKSLIEVKDKLAALGLSLHVPSVVEDYQYIGEALEVCPSYSYEEEDEDEDEGY